MQSFLLMDLRLLYKGKYIFFLPCGATEAEGEEVVLKEFGIRVGI